MTNKPTKKKDKKSSSISPEYDSTREQNVLLIDMHKDIKLVAEQHGRVIERLDRIESELDTVKVATMENSHEIKKLKSDVEQLKVGQAKLEAGQAKLEAGQAKLEQGQERIEQKLDTVTLDHEQRLTKLEAVR
jgi:uncharacterized phage infection (PIP) family protein YhgE